MFPTALWPGTDTLMIVPEASFIREDLVEYPKIRHITQSLVGDLKMTSSLLVRCALLWQGECCR